MILVIATAKRMHPSLPGIDVYLVDGEISKGKQQRVLVVMQPGSVIPLHHHSVDAQMFVVAGGARLRTGGSSKYRDVKVGDRVEFIRLHNHGFEAGSSGMSFLSTNGGIVDAGGDWDLTMTGGK